MKCNFEFNLAPNSIKNQRFSDQSISNPFKNKLTRSSSSVMDNTSNSHSRFDFSAIDNDVFMSQGNMVSLNSYILNECLIFTYIGCFFICR